MSRSSLSEQIYRILPGEQNKRIREAILAAAGYSGQRTDTLRRNIDDANRIKTGRLTVGTVNFTSPTNADVELFSWVINYQVFQQAALESIAVLAPHAEHARPDYFVGKSDGSVVYRAGVIDAFGNAQFPTVEADEVLLYSVLRKSDESNVPTPVDPAAPAHNSLPGIQGGTPAIGDQPAEAWHLKYKEEYLKLLKLIANVSANSVSQRGLTTYTSPESADSTNWKWVIGETELEVISETNATNGTPATYPTPDFFIGMPDGTIDYRPGVIDEFGNPSIPDIADDEVILDVVLRDPDGNNSSIPPDVYFEPPFPNILYQTAVQAATAGLYAKVWGATINPNNTYHIKLDYGAPSSESDWSTVNSGRSGRLDLTFFCLAGTAITGYIMETIDGKSQPGDWVLQRTGDQVALYHKSSDYWMRVYYRATFLAGAAFKSQMFNRQTYAALPGGSDQQIDSVPAIDIAGTSNELAYFAGSKSVRSLAVATYPSLTELVHVKGVTSAIQTQINGKIAHAPSDGSHYASKNGGWVAFTPFVVAGTATDGHVVTAVAGVPTWVAPSGGGSSLWTDATTHIYRDGKVVIGQTTLPLNATFAVRSKVSGSANVFQFMNDAGGNLVLFNNNGNQTHYSDRIQIIGTISGSNSAAFSWNDGTKDVFRFGYNGNLYTYSHSINFGTTASGYEFVWQGSSTSGGTKSFMLRNGAGSEGFYMKGDLGVVILNPRLSIGSAAASVVNGVYIMSNHATAQVLGLANSSGTRRHDFFASGDVAFYNLPTSDPGVPGRLWRSGTVVNISI